MIEDCVIVGGGVAGLSAANELADAGVSPLIIEAGKFPSHKICGEFISHECLPILDRWQIHLLGHIDLCRFISGSRKAEFRLPIASGSCSRYRLDGMLFERALNKGARALTETTVLSLNETSGLYELQLSNGQTVQARNLMIGTGRIPKLHNNQKPLELKYYGFKAHFENMGNENRVEMHLFPGGYLGISNVDDKTTNIACIVKKSAVNQPITFMDEIKNHPSMQIFKERMSKSKMIYPQWLMGQLPEFGIRSNPAMKNIFWIGDAAGSIPPICGDGLAIAITSGCLAADCFLKSNAKEFKNEWVKRYHRRFFIAKYIHKFMTTKYLESLAVEACRLFPSLPTYLWSQTRD